MIDKKDVKIYIEACGKRRAKYRCSCKDCNVDIGYKRERTYNKSGLCRTCSQRRAKAMSDEDKLKYPNVDFSDSKEVPFNKVKSNGNSFKLLYRVTCKFCGSDKGYVAKSLFDARCYKCTMTKERRISISAKQQNIEIDQWKEYTSPENTRERQSKRGRAWREAVFKKANYTCDITGNRGGTLNAHHLDSFDVNEDVRFDPENGVCLSNDIHKEFHSIYGKGSNTKEQYEEFKKAKLQELGPNKVD